MGLRIGLFSLVHGKPHFFGSKSILRTWIFRFQIKLDNQFFMAGSFESRRAAFGWHGRSRRRGPQGQYLLLPIIVHFCIYLLIKCSFRTEIALLFWCPIASAASFWSRRLFSSLDSEFIETENTGVSGGRSAVRKIYRNIEHDLASRVS